MKLESGDVINCNWCSWYSHQRIGTRTGGLGNKRTSRDHPNYGMIAIGQNTEKSSGDLQSLRVQWKTICYGWHEKFLKEKNNITNKWYIHHPESVLEYLMHKVFWILRYKQIN